MSSGPSGTQDGTGTDSAPPSDLRREFWILVGLFNIALLGIGLGLMLLMFEPGSNTGWPVLVVGLGAGSYGYGRYRRGQRCRSPGRQD